MRARLLLALGLGCSEPHVREDYDSETTVCLGGINEQVDDATKDQCADARNMWVKDGEVQQRPGYVGLSAIPARAGSIPADAIFKAENTGADPTTFITSAGAALTIAADYRQIGDRLYIGSSEAKSRLIVTVNAGFLNTAATQILAEYWNGSAWVHQPLFGLYSGSTSETATQAHTPGAIFSGASTRFSNVAPQDWVETTVDGVSRYWFRVTYENADLSGTVATTALSYGDVTNTGLVPFGMFVAKFASTKRYMLGAAVSRTNFATQARYINSATPSPVDSFEYLLTPANLYFEPSTMAVVPEFDEAYVAYDHQITVHKAYPSITDEIRPTVESRPEIVGPRAKYSTDFIAQLGEFPKAKYISYFKGFLWASGIEGDPHGIRWSAPGFGYRVWPLISRESLAESDNSEVRAQYGFGENMLVWKNDSMWQMVFRGTNAFGLAEFTPVRVPGAVGCVSQSSVVEIHGKVYWLAEDGVYSFDGTSVRPVFKDRIQSVFRRINPSRRAFAAATDWAQYNVYLLSVALDGGDANNTVLAYDYNRKAWWIWDEIEAQFWLNDEDSADNAVLYFGDASGRIYEFGKGLTDHGATIESYVTSRRTANAPVGFSKRARGVSVIANNLARALDVAILPDGAASGDSNDAVDFTDYDEVEYGAATATSEYVSDRQRTRYCGFRTDCRYFNTKVTHSTKNAPFTLYAMQAYYEPLGKRR